jgi:hypothetical protein
VPATEYFEEGRSLAQAFEVSTVRPISRIRGGHGHRQREGEGEDSKGEGCEGEEQRS